MPDVVQLADDEPRLLLRQNVPVAIVVVPDVLLIELRRRGPLERSAQRLPVPSRHDIHPIRIERRREQKDRVVENGLEARLVLGQQPVGELDRGVRRRKFGRVNRAGDQHDRLALGDQRLGDRPRRGARIGQLLLDLDVAVEILQRFRRGDDGGDQRPAFGRLAELLHANARAVLFSSAWK